jgi:hypothetical protein
MDLQKARKHLAEIKLETGKTNEAKTIVGEILKKNDKDLDGKFLNGRIALFEKRRWSILHRPRKFKGSGEERGKEASGCGIEGRPLSRRKFYRGGGGEKNLG